jgi:protein ImuA
VIDEGGILKMKSNTRDTFEKLKRELLSFSGYKANLGNHHSISIGPIDQAFPNNAFPIGALHEFLSFTQEDSAATYGFVMAVAGKIAQTDGVILWISTSRLVFPPALLVFGIKADNIVFLDLEKDRDCLWAMEEALKCEGLSAIVCETKQVDFTASRRFQLAVEQSGVTGFLLRHQVRQPSAIAALTRWKISPLQSELPNGIPGLGAPRWKVELQKVRNGRPGQWNIEFSHKEFIEIFETIDVNKQPVQQRKAG